MAEAKGKPWGVSPRHSPPCAKGATKEAKRNGI